MRGGMSPAERTEAEELKRVKAELAIAVKAMQDREARRIGRSKTVAAVVVLALIALAAVLLIK